MTTGPSQSALDTAGPHAAHIASLFWVQLAILGAVYAAVCVALVIALSRRRDAGAATKRRVVAGATIASGVILLGFLAANVVAGRQLAAASHAPVDAQVIEITAKQWWWEVRYLAPEGPAEVTDANELHLPAGKTVLLRLKSADVIHSFWVPSLHGKRDLVPGTTTLLTLRADRPGVYRGQCGEFCGAQHARMALHVVAHPPGEFAAWLERARQPATPPVDPVAIRGQAIFLSAPCRSCHNILGTDASGTAGPDLTHVASRRTLAAGTLDNMRAHLASWILDPQRHKPGSYMPAIRLSDEDLEALLTYLEGLR